MRNPVKTKKFVGDSLKVLGEQLRRSYLESTRALVAAVEARDPYTHDHSLRVSGFAVGIARRMGLDARETERIEIAAKLHDIGKIGIPDAILQKTDRLLPQEFEIVRQHPEIGVEILGHTTHLKRELPLILHHHERFDGGGYPAGLVGEQIPIGARILAVADALDAMLSRRAYRPALSMAEAKEEMRRNRGAQFDPAVVDVLLEWLEETDGQVAGNKLPSAQMREPT
ncbi:MAG: HD-GYP domain-containing protein [Planctomycetes bacterium]|nr:HD-GYP domain-containing protein [Planctomycetota bacterium]